MKHDQEKLRFELVEPQFMLDLAKVLTFGAKKYGPNDWQTLENGRDRYYAAIMRHMTAWRKGEIIDDESGLPHTAHAAASLMFLHWMDNYANRNTVEDPESRNCCRPSDKSDNEARACRGDEGYTVLLLCRAPFCL